MTLSEILCQIESGVRIECVNVAVFLDLIVFMGGQRDFIVNFDRLNGTTLSKPRPGGIIEMLDSATGYYEAQFELFAMAIFDLFWLRLPSEALYELANKRDVSDIAEGDFGK